MHLSTISLIIIPALLGATLTLALDNYHARDISVREESTVASVLVGETHTGSADIDSTYISYFDNFDQSSTFPSSTSGYYHTIITDTPLSVVIGSQREFSFTKPETSYTPETSQPLFSGSMTMPTATVEDPPHDSEAEDLTLSKSLHVHTLSNSLPQSYKNTGFSLPVFTFDDATVTSSTSHSVQSESMRGSQESSTNTVPTTLTSIAPAHLNSTTNTTSSRSDTLPSSEPNSAGILAPLSVSIPGALLVIAFVIGL